MKQTYRKIKDWYNKSGHKYINLPIIASIILVIIFIWLVSGQPRGRYRFQGLSGANFIFHRPRKGPSPHSMKEERCRKILENIYFKPFPSARPHFLKNPATGKNLEIDCFNQDLKIGLEYDGKQHSEYNPYFHRQGPKEFLYQVKKDDYKNVACKEEGITLIRVPHWVADTDLENYIRNKLRQTGKL